MKLAFNVQPAGAVCAVQILRVSTVGRLSWTLSDTPDELYKHSTTICRA